MSEFYIENEWLESIHGLEYFYPAAGSDITDSLVVFSPIVSRMVFNDYQEIRLSWVSQARELGMEVDRPDVTEQMQSPARRTRVVKAANGNLCEILITKAFGQEVLLNEFADGKIGVFFHRWDSIGEGGSNLRLWDDKLESRPVFGPEVSGINSILARKLADRALVVTDGSLMPFEFTQFRASNQSSQSFFEESKSQTHEAGGFQWHAVGWLGGLQRSAIVWGVSKLT